MELIGVLGGFIMGALIVWLVMRALAGKSTELFKARMEDLTKENDVITGELATERGKMLALTTEVANLKEANTNLNERQAENEKMLIRMIRS